MNILGQVDVTNVNRFAGITSKPIQTSQSQPTLNEPPQKVAKIASEQDNVVAAKIVQDALKSKNLNMQFSQDSETGKTIFQIVDSETKKVIRQIPSEDMIELSKSIDKMQGFFIKQQA